MLKTSSKRMLSVLALFAGAYAGQTLFADSRAHSAQAWYCVCNGEKKRFLASTRHCEVAMKVPKGSVCSKAQIRSVYAPACAQKGCKLAPLN